MRKISNRAKSNSSFGISDDSESSDEISGWEIEDIGEPKKNLKINKDVINLVNKKINLLDLFSLFKIRLEEVYSPSGWNFKCCCPLPKHKDNTPSFNFHQKENRFYCFGCAKGGGPVQFYANMKSITVFDACSILLEKYNSLEFEVEQLQDSDDSEIAKILLQFSETINQFIKNNNGDKALAFAESLMWGLDLYLHKNLPKRTIDVANLNARVNLLLSKLEKYGK